MGGRVQREANWYASQNSVPVIMMKNFLSLFDRVNWGSLEAT